MMRLLIDADGCPVVNEAIECARPRKIEVILVCDSAHYFERDGAKTVTVSQGADSADFRLVNMIAPGDIVVTQDYGLAAMALAKKARVLNQNGMEYTEYNIDSLLMARHEAQKIRRAEGRLKGPAKRRPEQNEDFCRALLRILDEQEGPA